MIGAGRSPANERVQDCPILVVDDTEFNRVIIGAMLDEAGYRNVAFANDGMQALAAIEAQPPDLVLLDIMMPGIDGFEVCRRIRLSYQNADLPVLVQTALSSMDDRNRAFEVGATDLVSKPIERYELLARVRNHLENRVLIRRRRAYRERVEQELTIAKGMYEHLNPTLLQRDWILRSTGVAVRCHSRLSSELGGAIWGVSALADRRVGVFIADMSGKGLAAALNAFRLHTLAQELKDLAEMPAVFMTALNARASALLQDGDRGRALFGVLDPAADLFTYAAAGDLRPRIARGGAAELAVGDAGGEEIGAAPDHVHRSRSVEFHPGDVLVLENRPLPKMTQEDGGEADPMAVAALAAAADGGDEAFAWLADGVDGLEPADCDDDYLAVWLDRTALDADPGEA